MLVAAAAGRKWQSHRQRPWYTLENIAGVHQELAPGATHQPLELASHRSLQQERAARSQMDSEAAQLRRQCEQVRAVAAKGAFHRAVQRETVSSSLDNDLNIFNLSFLVNINLNI